MLSHRRVGAYWTRWFISNGIEQERMWSMVCHACNEVHSIPRATTFQDEGNQMESNVGGCLSHEIAFSARNRWGRLVRSWAHAALPAAEIHNRTRPTCLSSLQYGRTQQSQPRQVLLTHGRFRLASSRACNSQEIPMDLFASSAIRC